MGVVIGTVYMAVDYVTHLALCSAASCLFSSANFNASCFCIFLSWVSRTSAALASVTRRLSHSWCTAFSSSSLACVCECVCVYPIRLWSTQTNYMYNVHRLHQRNMKYIHGTYPTNYEVGCNELWTIPIEVHIRYSLTDFSCFCISWVSLISSIWDGLMPFQRSGMTRWDPNALWATSGFSVNRSPWTWLHSCVCVSMCN